MVWMDQLSSGVKTRDRAGWETEGMEGPEGKRVLHLKAEGERSKQGVARKRVGAGQ
jgi:hypothetical protein